MKAIDNFLVEATKQYGENAVISVDQAQQVLKDIKRAIGIGHIKQAGMVSGMGEFAQVKLKSVNAAKTDVAVVTKKEVVKEVEVVKEATPVVETTTETTVEKK